MLSDVLSRLVILAPRTVSTTRMPEAPEVRRRDSPRAV